MEKYFEKIDQVPKEEILWNVPEQKQGTVAVIGGNSQNFRTSIKVAEYLTANFPLREVGLVLPDVLEKSLPPLDNVKFLASTDSGSFADEKELAAELSAVDFGLMVGDFSKNAITAKAVANAVKTAPRPLIATRDAVDLLSEAQPERWLMNENVILMASMAQLQKLFRAVYYPKMLMLTQSLMQVAEALHKFTLSYPVSIITLHDGQILIAKNGSVRALALEKTTYSPLTLWGGEAAAKIMALALYSPGQLMDAAAVALSA